MKIINFKIIIVDKIATIFSAGLDHALLGWEYSIEEGSDRLMFECKGHKGPIESIAVDAKNKFVSFCILTSIVTQII